jgi:hypothetical protein
MKLVALLGASGLSLLACKGGSAPPATPVTPGPGSAVGTPVGPDAAPADPHLAARRAFANPGGMWLPQQMTLPGHAATFAALGVTIDPTTLADPLAAPLGAIVRLNGCSASLVSPDGLVVTNHHCIQSALQINSSPTRNLVNDGFVAATRADELPAGPAERVFVAQAFADVTGKIRDGLDAIADPGARVLEVERRQKQLIADCERGRPGLRCSIAEHFRGGTYVLTEELEIRDVRLVYAPPRGIGNYGGEVDNWRWPRHTGDFSFYRAYVGPDGAPADPSPANVPYRPRHHLQVSDRGVAPHDFVMIAGFPGRTTRTRTAREVTHDVEWFYPYFVALARQRYDLVSGFLTAPGDTAIKAGVQKQRIQNALEKTEGVRKGLTSGDLLARKADLDARIAAWAAAPGRERERAALERLAALIADEQRTARADYDRAVALSSSQLLGAALTITRWADERTKPDADRKPGLQDRDLARALAAQKQLTRQYDPAIDRATLRLALVRALELPEAERPWLRALLGLGRRQVLDAAAIDRTLDGWYRAPGLADEARRLALLTKATPRQLARDRDPLLAAIGRIWKLYKAEERRADARAGELLLVAPVYTAAMREVLGGQLAPDANSTLRITYGTVKPRTPGDPAFTTASQILAKDTGVDPFDAPPRLLEAIRARAFGPYAGPDGELPVNFLSDLDTTGGNSGSAVLDKDGRLVALNFDSTIEGVASDVVFDGAMVRKIHVDVRYLLWVLDRVDGADHLIRELGLEPRL